MGTNSRRNFSLADTCSKVMLVATLLMLSGCSNLLFVTDKDGGNQIYKMRIADVGPASPSEEVVSHDAAHGDKFPDISPDIQKFAYSSVRSGQRVIATRDLSDTAGTTEQILRASTTTTLLRPRWSCQGDLVAYMERTPNSNDAKIMVVRADGSAAPIQVASPGTYKGHDWVFDGNWIVYASRLPNTAPAGYGLSLVKSDGSGTVVGPFTSGELPTVSHDGKLLAYVQRSATGAGTAERINVVDSRTFAVKHQFSIQPSIGAKKIEAIGFSGDDNELYVATEVSSVSAPSREKRYELFVTNLDGSGLKRLTDNTDYDSHPDGIPKAPVPFCQRCAEISAEQEASATQTLTINGVVFTAATLPSGTPSTISITDYCPRNDGKRELKVPWSETSSGSGQFATIRFPQNLFGDGPSRVEVTACHQNQLSFRAYDKNDNLLADVPHTAGQRQLQTLNLSVGSISRIDIVGAEIGIRDVCYTP
jgi:Tol biopolymer transport system component